jgi:hypothetical protein
LFPYKCLGDFPEKRFLTMLYAGRSRSPVFCSDLFPPLSTLLIPLQHPTRSGGVICQLVGKRLVLQALFVLCLKDQQFLRVHGIMLCLLVLSTTGRDCHSTILWVCSSWIRMDASLGRQAGGRRGCCTRWASIGFDLQKRSSFTSR